VLYVDFKLSKEQELIQKAAREYAINAILPLAKQIDEEDKIPQEIWDGLAELGFMGIPFEDELGGGGADYECYVLAQEQIARASSGVATALSVHTTGLDVIAIFGNKEQKEKYIPLGCSGKSKSSFAFTEPGTGSDPKQLTTIATREGDYYVINGVKRFITNAGYEGPMVIFCKDSDTGDCSAYILDKFNEGYSLSKPWEKIGAHGSPVFDVYLKDVKVPAANLLGKPGQGFLIAMETLDRTRPMIAAVGVGTAQGCLDYAIQYAKQRVVFGKPIAALQAIQFKLADMAMKTEAARQLTYRAAILIDAYLEGNKDITRQELSKLGSMAKCYATDVAMYVTTEAIQVCGGYGFMKDYPIERRFREAKLLQIIEGTNEIQRTVIAGNLLTSSRWLT